jgi:hypothetical protein
VQSYFPHYVFCEEYSSSKIVAECQTSDTKSADLHCRIIWYAREGLKRLEIVLPIVTHYKEFGVVQQTTCQCLPSVCLVSQSTSIQTQILYPSIQTTRSHITTSSATQQTIVHVSH